MTSFVHAHQLMMVEGFTMTIADFQSFQIFAAKQNIILSRFLNLGFFLRSKYSIDDVKQYFQQPMMFYF